MAVAKKRGASGPAGNATKKQKLGTSNNNNNNNNNDKNNKNNNKKGSKKGKRKFDDSDDGNQAEGEDNFKDGSGDESDFEVADDMGFPTVRQARVADADGDGNDDEDVRAAKASKRNKSGGFQSMGLSHNLLKGVLRKGYKVPTPIQRKTIPLALEGRDIVAMARTGSGKTAAFLLPMFERLAEHSAKTGVRALVLSPTRELALQTVKFVKELGKYTGLRACLLVGGDSMEDQFALMHSNPDIVIATPGRLTHLLIEMNMNLSSCEYVVFDEADRLFEMGFSEQVTEITSRLPSDRQTLLFSATLPKMLVNFAQAGLRDPVLVRLDVDTKLSEDLKLSFFSVRKTDRVPVLVHLLKSNIASDQLTVVFVATKHHVEYLRELLTSLGIDTAYIYGALDPAARKIQLAKFRTGKSHVLVVTDVAARGIDIPILDNVIMYDFSPSPKLFQHRVGRVARAGRAGNAYCLVTPEEVPYFLDLHLFLGRPIKLAGDDGNGQPKYPANEDGVVGTVPEPLLAELRDQVRDLHAQKFDLEAQRQVMENAYKMYDKSRPKPSSESCKRAKELDMHIGFHPCFASQIDQSELAASVLLQGVKQYRPRQTVFELHKTGAATNQAAEIMKKKREMHAETIQKNERKEALKRAELAVPCFGSAPEPVDESTEEAVKATFGTIVDPAWRKRKGAEIDLADEAVPAARDTEHYIPHRPANHFKESGLSLGDSFAKQAQSEVLDLMGEEATDMRKKKNQVKWDRKKKKFVQESNEGKNKKIRTESGHVINASYNTKLYAEWKKKHHVGQDNQSIPTMPNGRARGRGNYAKTQAGGAKVRDELKNKDQIAKERKIKERKQKHVKDVRAKKAARGGGKKGGGKGGRGRR